ncbi:hypothetical protein PgNI_10869 [Pyricularia grisea]|uniref:Uncharacterized protein n=1 Tax=Pyricularia grisea TaxID=148305 RepID=A0A6P8AZU8_PYRGI|nr:hypothetical protein PgNI_10869 [Pyricularia grisea]TLD07839.1 hypothetical protein PgNI_10869 [Pyricularia grisea]
MLTPVKWYQIGQIKIWTKQKKTDFVKDGTKFDTVSITAKNTALFSVPLSVDQMIRNATITALLIGTTSNAIPI